MKVPANLSGDRLILDYLTRVTVAGTRYLPKGSRIAFVGTTRNRIEREIGPHGAADPARVREVLARLGEPEDLVRAERARLDAERISRQSRAAGAGATEVPVAAPVESRPINSRWRPATRARPTRQQPPAGQDAGPQDRSVWRRGAAGNRKRKGRLGGLLKDRPGTGPAEPEAQASSVAAADSHAGQAPGGAAGQAPGGGAAGQVPGSTDGQAPDGAAGQAPGGADGQAPGGAAGQAPDGADGQAPDGAARQVAGGADWWPWGGGSGRPPGGTGSPSPDAMGSEPGTRASRWAAAAGAGTQASGGTGTGASGGAGTGGPAGAGTRAPGEAGTRAGTPGPETGRTGPPPQELTPTAVIPPTAGSRPAGRGGSSGGDTPVHGIPVLPPRTSAPREPWTLRTAAAALGHGAARLAMSAARLARRYPLETAAVMLLALGGFVFPFPYWLFGGLLGGLLSIRSPMWLARDKWVAVIGPVVIMITGTILAAVVTGGHGGAVTAYPHAFVAYAGNLLRLGNVLCAAYLVVQARRAPQRRLPPWQRQRQPPPRQLR